jgi:hypothetical protein
MIYEPCKWDNQDKRQIDRVKWTLVVWEVRICGGPYGKEISRPEINLLLTLRIYHVTVNSASGSGMWRFDLDRAG